MITVRQIQRLWDARRYDRLAGELLAARVESTPQIASRLAGSAAAAALALIRLDELNQAHVPLAAKLVRCIVASQSTDGGWCDPITSALCIRALLTGRGHGDAIDRGIVALATLQKTEGIWPAEPIRRLAADPLASAFILLQLAACGAFRDAIRFDDAVAWFESHADQLDSDTRKLWSHARLRSRTARPMAMSWS